MIRFARACIAALVAAVLAACGGGGGGGGSAPIVNAPSGRTESLTVASQATGASYSMFVYLPAQYEANPQARFPVIYAVDGDAQFGYPNDGTRFDALKTVLQQRGSAAVLVGVGGTSRRNTDFLPPGSVAYHQFLANELAPAIDARYRTDTTNRILSGLSNGGTITYLAFTYEATGPHTFKQFWSTETAAPNGIAQIMFDADTAMAAQVQGGSVPVTLFLAGATPTSSSGPVNGTFVAALGAQIAARNYTGLDLEQATYTTTHVGADLPAFNDALMRFIK